MSDEPEKRVEVMANDAVVGAIEEISAKTGEAPEDVILRAIGIYKSIVEHITSGSGVVRFVNNDLSHKTLKIPNAQAETRSR